MPTTILDGETYTEALQRRYAEEATRDLAHVVTSDPLYQQGFVDGVEEGRRQIEEAEQQGLVATAWNEGYRQGIEDERTSEANIGIAGFNAKVEPNRCNPYEYCTAQPQREWVEPSHAQIQDALPTVYEGDYDVAVARAVLKLAKELNR